MLAGKTYRQLTDTRLRREVIGRLDGRAITEQQKIIQQHHNWTVSLDGWEDCTHISYYAVLLVDNKRALYLDNLELDHKRHTADIIREELKKVLTPYLSRVKAIVTDSPTTMNKMRNELHKDLPHIVVIRCVLHVINLISKDVYSSPTIKPLVKKLTTVASFFSSSQYWRTELSKWGQENRAGPFVSSFVEVRWYSFIKMCMSVMAFQKGFEEMHTMYQGGVGTVIPSKVADLIADSSLFRDCEYIIQITKPLADAIAVLESRSAHLGDVWPTIFKLQKYFDDQLDNFRFYPIIYQRTLKTAIGSLNKRASDFNIPIYVVALFLCPGYRHIAISKEHNLKKLQKMILELCNDWEFSQYEATQLYNVEIIAYSNNMHPHHSTEHDPIKYWESIQNDCPCLAKFARIIFDLVPSSASIESLFSMLKAAKPKERANMSKDTLCCLGRIKLDHYNSEKESESDLSNVQFDGWSFVNLIDLVDDGVDVPNDGLNDGSDGDSVREIELESIEVSMSQIFAYNLPLYNDPTNQPTQNKKWAVSDIMES